MTVVEAVTWIKQGSHIIDRIIIPFIRKIWTRYTLNKHGFRPIMSCCMSGEINCAKRTKVELRFWSLGGGSLQTVRSSLHVELKLLNVTEITESSDTPQSCSGTWNVRLFRGHGVRAHTRRPVSGTRTRKGSTQLQSDARWRGGEGAQRTLQNGLKSHARLIFEHIARSECEIQLYLPVSEIRGD